MKKASTDKSISEVTTFGELIKTIEIPLKQSSNISIAYRGCEGAHPCRLSKQTQ